MKDFTRRTERMEETLKTLAQQRRRSKHTLVYADGSHRSMGFLEAVKEIGEREDIVDVLSEGETASSLLRGILGPWDFSDLPELKEFYPNASE